MLRFQFLQPYFLFFLIFFSAGLFAAPDNKNIDSPTALGPYQIGVVTTSVLLTNNRSARIHVWYPTSQSGSLATYVSNSPVITYPTPFGASSNVSVADGRFPLIINNHPSAGDTSYYAAVSQNELLASHGFIVVNYVRPTTNNTNCPAVYNDLKLMMEMMIDKNNGTTGSTLGSVNFLDKIDADRIGVAGYSSGAIPALGLSTGNSSQSLSADSRIKAIVLYEPAALTTCNLSLADEQALAIPYLEMDGSPATGLIGAQLFNDTINSIPRFHVHTPNAVHFSYATFSCFAFDFLRETSLARQTAAGINPLIEPLTHTVPPTVDQAAGINAFTLWNLDAVNPNGGVRQYCNRTGVNSVYINLDANTDGFTDIPPYNCTGPNISGQTCNTFAVQNHPSGEDMEKLVYHYSVSFWKVFLEGDGRYMRFLTEGYAQQNFSNSVFTKIEE